MKTYPKPLRQRGVTLIELMVGLAIGLLVIAVAMGALMVSRGVSGTVSDASGIQQQGAYIMRVIGQQLRQTGSLYLNPAPSGESSTEVLSAVAFEIKANAVGTGNSFVQEDTLVGSGNSVTTGFRRYQDNVFMIDGTNADSSASPPTPATPGTDYLARNCVGAPGNSSTDQRIESAFTFADDTLRCQGNGVNTPQPIAQNVAQFQVTYLVQSTDATGTKVQYIKGSDLPSSMTANALDPAWRRVQGVQVCVVLYGNESIDLPSGTSAEIVKSRSYTDCAGNSVDLSSLTGARRNRMHMLFTSTYQLRSQGLLTNAS